MLLTGFFLRQLHTILVRKRREPLVFLCLWLLGNAEASSDLISIRRLKARVICELLHLAVTFSELLDYFYSKGFGCGFLEWFVCSPILLIGHMPVTMSLEFLGAACAIILSVIPLESLLEYFNLSSSRYLIGGIISDVISCTESLLQMPRWIHTSWQTKYVKHIQEGCYWSVCFVGFQLQIRNLKARWIVFMEHGYELLMNFSW
jgi:hypothetical protein